MSSTHPEQEIGAFTVQRCSDVCRQSTPIFLLWQILTVQYCAWFPPPLGWIGFLKQQLRPRGINDIWRGERNLYKISGWASDFGPHDWKCESWTSPPQPCCSGGWSGYTLFCIRWWVIAIKSLTEIRSPSICWYVIGVFFLRRMRMYQEQQVSSRNALWGLKPSVQQRKVSC